MQTDKGKAFSLLTEVGDRLRGKTGETFLSDLEAFLKDPTRWRKIASGTAMPLSDDALREWMQGVFEKSGIACEVPPAPTLTPKQKKAFCKFGFRLFFLPAIGEVQYPSEFVKPAWGKYLDAAQIERKPLSGRWVAVETIAKPNWDDPNGYADDRLGAALKLKRRFVISWDALHEGILAKVSQLICLPPASVRLPTAEEWNLLGNLFNSLRKNGENLPDLGSTNSWEWCENASGSGSRLIVGLREYGGLSAVDGCWRDYRLDDIGFRVLAVL